MPEMDVALRRDILLHKKEYVIFFAFIRRKNMLFQKNNSIWNLLKVVALLNEEELAALSSPKNLNCANSDDFFKQSPIASGLEYANELQLIILKLH